MALQGSIDTFALGDVLRLLAGTGKTGRLALDGDRGRGEVVVVDGGVRAVTLLGRQDGSGTHDEALFELLRFRDADFVFDPDEGVRDVEGEALDVEPLLAAAESLLVEWREIEQVVPSPGAWLTLRADLPADEVVLDADRWRLVATVGSGTTAATVSERFGTSELATGRLVRAAVELGVVDVAAEAPPLAEPEDVPDPSFETGSVEAEPTPYWTDEAPAEAPVAAEPTPHWTDDVPSWGDAPTDAPDPVAAIEGADGPSGGHGDDAPRFTVLDGGAPVSPGLSLDDERVSALLDDDEDAAAAEFARQLANLSPKAAKAVAAAARAESPEERDRVLAEVEASEEGLDHELLLRFIGTAD